MKKIFIICSGVEIVKRGFETSARDLFDHLKNEGANVYLIKGGGKSAAKEKKIFCINRFSNLNKIICGLLRNPKKNYYIEFLSFSFFLTPFILLQKPSIIYVYEAPIYQYLVFIKSKLRLKYKLIHFSGGQIVNQLPDKDAIIHHVTPYFIEKAISLGFAPTKQILLPHFIGLHKQVSFLEPDEIKNFKSSSGIPLNRRILISVGNIDYSVKRMDYIIKELEYLKNEYFLILLGQFSDETEYILNLAKNKLGENNFLIKTVPREEINYYYQASDIFVLASLMEGFGLVYLEALANGLPVIAHDFAVSRYVLKNQGIYLDLSQYGALRNFLSTYQYNNDLKIKDQRFKFVYSNYSWDVLKKDYLKLFGLNKNE